MDVRLTADRTVDGRRLKFLAVLEERTRRCLALEVERGMTSRSVIAVLARLVEELERTTPTRISTNGRVVRLLDPSCHLASE